MINLQLSFLLAFTVWSGKEVMIASRIIMMEEKLPPVSHNLQLQLLILEQSLVDWS